MTSSGVPKGRLDVALQNPSCQLQWLFDLYTRTHNVYSNKPIYIYIYTYYIYLFIFTFSTYESGIFSLFCSRSGIAKTQTVKVHYYYSAAPVKIGVHIHFGKTVGEQQSFEDSKFHLFLISELLYNLYIITYIRIYT